MSQRRKGRQQNSDDEYYEDTQQSQSQQLTSSELTKIAGQVCNLLLVGEMKKIPVKSAYIRKTVIQNRSRSVFQEVMGKAEEIMKQVFGYKIVLVKGSSYILCNKLSHSFTKYQKPEKLSDTHGILVAILTAIFMSEGKMSAGALESYLSALDIDVAKEGKQMFAEFSRKLYLEAIVEDSGDSMTKFYQWGERAHAEFSKKEILEFVCEVYGNMNPSMWTNQWKMITEGKVKQSVMEQGSS